MVALLRWLGGFQLLELMALDGFFQLRFPEAIDPRIVIVEITESDIQFIGQDPIPDRVIAEALTNISAQKPRVIGLDLYRNVAIGEGHDQLTRVFQTTPNLIGIEKIVDNPEGSGSAISANPELAKADRVAASDLLLDLDSRVRRGFLYLYPEQREPQESFGLRLALIYLAQDNLHPTSGDRDALQLHQATFPPLGPNFGGYIRTDAGGYQILLNLRRPDRSFRRVTLRSVLQGSLPPNLLTNKVVLIGFQSVSGDSFLTAYSRNWQGHAGLTSGVEIHANLTSQIISAALGDRPLMRSLPDWVEYSSIVIAGLISALIGMRLKIPLGFLSTGLTLTIAVFIICYLAFLQGFWLPLVPLEVAIGASMLGLLLQKSQQHITLATVDELTQLLNRRAFNDQINELWQQGAREQQPLTVIMCDVDFFKLYNDTYGHLAGDECLRQVAWAIQRGLPRSSQGFAARYGGEEFSVVLPRTHAQDAVSVVETIQEHLRQLKLPHLNSKANPYVSLSFGIASTIPSPNQSPLDLVQIADQALYKSKQQGRDRWTIAGS